MQQVLGQINGLINIDEISSRLKEFKRLLRIIERSGCILLLQERFDQMIQEQFESVSWIKKQINLCIPTVVEAKNPDQYLMVLTFFEEATHFFINMICLLSAQTVHNL